jgi:hypothetical protein
VSSARDFAVCGAKKRKSKKKREKILLEMCVGSLDHLDVFSAILAQVFVPELWRDTLGVRTRPMEGYSRCPYQNYGGIL